jgi:hypothetical protein
MKLSKIFLIIFYILVISSNSEAKEKIKKQSTKWSNYQGEMNWFDAVKKCAKLKMRLPTRDEMESEFKKKTITSWKKDGYWFWTSDEYSKGDAYYFDVGLGLVVDHLKEEVNHVRCISK